MNSLIEQLGQQASKAASVLANCSTAQKNDALLAIARDLPAHADEILEQNAMDYKNAKQRSVAKPMLLFPIRWERYYPCGSDPMG